MRNFVKQSILDNHSLMIRLVHKKFTPGGDPQTTIHKSWQGSWRKQWNKTWYCKLAWEGIIILISEVEPWNKKSLEHLTYYDKRHWCAASLLRRGTTCGTILRPKLEQVHSLSQEWRTTFFYNNKWPRRCFLFKYESNRLCSNCDNVTKVQLLPQVRRQPVFPAESALRQRAAPRSPEYRISGPSKGCEQWQREEAAGQQLSHALHVLARKWWKLAFAPIFPVKSEQLCLVSCILLQSKQVWSRHGGHWYWW